jgi:hypothetical protein
MARIERMNADLSMGERFLSAAQPGRSLLGNVSAFLRVHPR